MVTFILAVNVLALIFLWKRDQHLLYVVFSISLLLLFGLTVKKEFVAEWRDYQQEYIQMQIDKESNPEVVSTLKKTPIKIKQIWNPELGIADRCTTCHLGVDDPAFKDAAEPFRYHKAAREHDFNQIGCTICHRGQGRATETKEAHAKDIHHWESPMWELDMVQVSCPQCHEDIYHIGNRLKGAELLSNAVNLLINNELEMECFACHTIRKVGEALAPDLTEFGARTEHEFEQTHDMRYVEGEKDMYNWTFQHFIDPLKISPGDPDIGMEPTIMPNFSFTDEQARALTALVFSYKASLIPAKFQYREATKEEKKVGERISFIKEFEESYEDFEELTRGQQLFIRSNCWFCHKINGKGGRVGPDLTHIGKKRTKANILKFWATVTKKTRHPMSNRFNKFEDEQLEYMAEYLSGLK
jgi:cytochrome c2